MNTGVRNNLVDVWIQVSTKVNYLLATSVAFEKGYDEDRMQNISFCRSFSKWSFLHRDGGGRFSPTHPQVHL